MKRLILVIMAFQVSMAQAQENCTQTQKVKICLEKEFINLSGYGVGEAANTIYNYTVSNLTQKTVEGLAFKVKRVEGAVFVDHFILGGDNRGFFSEHALWEINEIKANHTIRVTLGVYAENPVELPLSILD